MCISTRILPNLSPDFFVVFVLLVYVCMCVFAHVPVYVEARGQLQVFLSYHPSCF